MLEKRRSGRASTTFSSSEPSSGIQIVSLMQFTPPVALDDDT